ncbi:MAG: DMT family transporter [Acidobacteria bacterium]|nr:DMT family transporter [Acidobacteriota bacterium]
MTRKDASIFLLLILTFLIWSNSFLAIAALRESTTAFELVVMRFVPVGVISLVIAFGFHRREALQLLRAHPVRVGVIGLLTVIGYNFFLNHGMAWVTPAASSLLVSLTPLLTLLMAMKFLHEAFSLRRLLGTLLAFGGLAVVVVFGKVGNMPGGALIPAEKVPYAVCVMLASVCWSVATVLTKPLMERYSPVTVNFVMLSVGCLPLFGFLSEPILAKWGAFSPAQHLALLFLSIACTVVAFALWFVALKHWKASNVTLFVYLNPPLTAVFDFLVNRHAITPWFAVGGVVMLGGIFLATRPKS